MNLANVPNRFSNERRMYVQYELYIDIFFLENFLMDFLVLTMIKKTMNSAASYKTLGAGAFFGAFLSSLMICLQLPMMLKLLLLHLVINTGMIGIGFRIHRLREGLQPLFLLYTYSFLLGGVIGWIKSNLNTYYKIGCMFLVVAVPSYFIVQKVLDMLEAYLKIPEKYCNVTLSLGERSCTVRALIDSGNQLVDDISGKPVHIISTKVMKKLTNENEVSMIRYIPYCTIHEEKGVLPVMKIDKMCIHQKNEKEIAYPIVGIASHEKFGGGAFEMILHPKDC